MARARNPAPGEHKIALGREHLTGNFWVDTGLVVLLRQFGEGEHSVEEVLRWLQSRLLQPSGNRGEYYDEQTGEIRPYNKVNWIYPTNLFIKVSGVARKIKAAQVRDQLRRKLEELERSGERETVLQNASEAAGRPCLFGKSPGEEVGRYYLPGATNV
jgi:hypothetical protein